MHIYPSVPAVLNSTLLQSPIAGASNSKIDVDPYINPSLVNNKSSVCPDSPEIFIKNYPIAPAPFIFEVVTIILYLIFDDPDASGVGH